MAPSLLRKFLRFQNVAVSIVLDQLEFWSVYAFSTFLIASSVQSWTGHVEQNVNLSVLIAGHWTMPLYKLKLLRILRNSGSEFLLISYLCNDVVSATKIRILSWMVNRIWKECGKAQQSIRYLNTSGVQAYSLTATDRSRAEKLWLVCGVTSCRATEREIYTLVKHLMLLSILKKWQLYAFAMNNKASPPSTNTSKKCRDLFPYFPSLEGAWLANIQYPNLSSFCRNCVSFYFHTWKWAMRVWNELISSE
jgi:hypothetical protein